MSRRRKMSNSGNLSVCLVIAAMYTLMIAFFLYMTVYRTGNIFRQILRLRNYYQDAPAPGFSFIMESPLVTDLEERETLLEEIRSLNAEQKIYNLDTFGPVTEATNVMVIQVHTRLKYLKVLIESLRQAKGIEDSLLIFSHDVFLPKINDYIRNLTFTRVMQIFYPHSIQLHPYGFPGLEGKKTGQSYDWSPKAAQIKLHWWWKVNFVFDQVEVLKNFTATISFTEEDTYFTENSLWMLNLMKKAMIEDRCRGCQWLSLIEDERSGTVVLNDDAGWYSQFNPDYSEVVLSNWLANYFLAFNRTVWSKIKRCSREFCRYNDYNWDWSLKFLIASGACIEKPFKLLSAKWPRVFHTGDCGYHVTRGKKCNPNWHVKQAMEDVKQYSSLFPATLGPVKVKLRSRWTLLPERPYGGWEHPRIVEFCMSMVQGGNG